MSITVEDVQLLSDRLGVAVGSQNSSAIFLKWNGHEWAQDATLNETDLSLKVLKVNAHREGEGWAVGYRQPAEGRVKPLAVRWSEGHWSIQPLPGSGADITLLRSVASLNENEALAVGHAFSVQDVRWSAYAASWNGVTWDATPFPPDMRESQLYLTDVAQVDGQLLAFGTDLTDGSCVVLAYAGGWSVKSRTRLRGIYIDRVSFASQSYGFASATTDDGKSCILRWDGSNWARENTPSPGDPTVISDVKIASETTAFASGFYWKDGHAWPMIVRRDAKGWARLSTPKSNGVEALSAVSLTGPHDVAFVGSSGLVVTDFATTLRFDGSKVRRTPNPFGFYARVAGQELARQRPDTLRRRPLSLHDVVAEHAEIPSCAEMQHISVSLEAIVDRFSGRAVRASIKAVESGTVLVRAARMAVATESKVIGLMSARTAKLSPELVIDQYSSSLKSGRTYKVGLSIDIQVEGQPLRVACQETVKFD
jgi:hypothetical protein